MFSVCACVSMKDHPEWSIRHWPRERWWKPGRIAQHSFKPEPRWQTQMTTAADDETGLLMCSCCCVGASENDSRQGQKCCLELNVQTMTYVQFLSWSIVFECITSYICVPFKCMHAARLCDFKEASHRHTPTFRTCPWILQSVISHHFSSPQCF